MSKRKARKAERLRARQKRKALLLWFEDVMSDVLKAWATEQVFDKSVFEIFNSVGPAVKFDKAMAGGDMTVKTFVTESGMIVVEDVTEDAHKKPVDTSAEVK